MKNYMRGEVTFFVFFFLGGGGGGRGGFVVVFSACRKNVWMTITCNRYDVMNIM